MSFDRNKLYIYRGLSGGYFSTCTDCRGVYNHSLIDGGDAVKDGSREASELTKENIERGFDNHARFHEFTRASDDVKDKAPLNDPLDDLKAIVDDAVKEYAPRVKQALTEFGLRTFLK